MWSFFSRDSSKDFTFEFGDIVENYQFKSVFSLHKAKRKGSNEAVSIFSFDVKNGNNFDFDTAKALLKRLKTLRHPCVLQYLDSIETDKFLHISTEYINPLPMHLSTLAMTELSRELYVSWGLFQITRALSFLLNDGQLKHNNLSAWSIFVNSSGEWKLGGLEYVSSVEECNSVSFKRPLSLEIYDPPEKKDNPKLKQATNWSGDMWGLGCLIWESFNRPLQSHLELQEIETIPKSLAPVYIELIGVSPQNRPNPADVITRCRKPGGFFKNELVDTLLFLEEIQMKDKSEKNKFFNDLTVHLDNFPENICKFKILPQLITTYEYGDAGPAILNPLFKLGRLLEESDYQRKIVPCIVKLFTSSDRITRSRLLQQIDLFIGRIQVNIVNEQIFPQVVHGFLDTNPTIREQTVKSVIHLAPKLNYNNLNVEILRHFARLQSRDDQGGIRTNTTVCLGKIAPHLHPQVRQRVLVSAFIRAMKDPFPPARIAGILALAATQQYFLLVEVSNRILPALAPLTADPEKSVRDPAFKTIRGFLGKLEKVSEDPGLRETMEADVNTATPSLSNAAATWAGWAVTAVTSKFYRSQSDTVNPRPTLTGNSMNKPGSLEQPSSSSISTTTSSVTSMTSLEHESNDASASASDYGHENWDHGNWGDMENFHDTNNHILQSHINPNHSSMRDGWDNEEWASLEEENEEESKMSHMDSIGKIEITNNNKVSNELLDAKSFQIKESLKSSWNQSDSWTDGEFEPIEDGVKTAKIEENRIKREERKLQRQRELEERRAARASVTKIGSRN